MDEILTPEQWYELQSRIRQQHPELTDSDLQYHEALEQDLLAMVEFSLLKTQEPMHGFIGTQNRLFPLKYHWRSRKHFQVSLIA